MTEVAIARLTAAWPDARISVFTTHPELLPHTSQTVQPLSNDGRLGWLNDNLFPFVSHFTRGQARSRALAIRHPRAAAALRAVRYPHRREHRRQVSRFLAGLPSVDAFLVAGMGGLTDAFPEYTTMILETLDLCHSFGIPTFLFGQGIGPFGADLEKRAAEVLTKVSYIALREGLHGPQLLRKWGVPQERWCVTGDDAIELAFPKRRAELGRCIGLNLRKASYSAVSTDLASALRTPLRQLSAQYDTSFCNIPISRLPDEKDADQVQKLLEGVGLLEAPGSALDTPSKIVEEVSRCRLIITGSYHAGVFALSQGIPVIGLVANDYYDWKFSGLAHQFGEGCCLLRLTSPTVAADLVAIFQHLWEHAEELRPRLLEKASEQLREGRAVFGEIKNQIDGRMHKP